jgi:phage terminase small subunit
LQKGRRVDPMTEPKTREKPPIGLKKDGKTFWMAVTTRYEILGHHRPLLEQACRCLDRAAEIRKKIDNEGLTICSAKGEVRPHPLLVAERDLRRTYGYLVKTLGLTDENTPKRGRRPGGVS